MASKGVCLLFEMNLHNLFIVNKTFTFFSHTFYGIWVHTHTLVVSIITDVLSFTGYRFVTGGNMNGKRQRIVWEQRVLRTQHGWRAWGLILFITSLFWHTTVPAPAHPPLELQSSPRNLVRPLSYWTLFNIFTCMHSANAKIGEAGLICIFINPHILNEARM